MLGPMEILGDDGGAVVLGGIKQRATLGFLLLQANRVVATSQLMNALWGLDDAPTTARKILQNAVYRLRGVLSPEIGGIPGRTAPGAPALLTQPPGYMLRVDPDRVDLHRFHRWVAEGREKLALGEHEPAARLLRDALALWRGRALADLVETGTDWPELIAVQNTRLDVMEDYFEAQLACGRHHAILSGLETMADAEPLRERCCGQLMLALYRCGRQADALNVYSRIRSALVEDLGLEPSRRLQRLQHAILTQDPELFLTEPEPAGSRVPAGQAVDLDRFRRPAASTVPAPVVPAPAPAPASAGPVPAPVPAPAEATGTPPRPAAPTAPAPEQPAAPDRRRVSVVAVRTRLAPTLGGAGSERLDELLDGTASVVREHIEHFGGTVTASFGSTILALFGLRESREDDSRRAVLAALAIRDKLDVARCTETEGAELTVRTAVTAGDVLLRRRGGEEAPMVVGVVLDEAETLLAAVPVGEVWTSEAVRRATTENVNYRAVARGWQVTGVRGEPDGLAGATGECGLTYELDVLRGLMQRSRHRTVPYLFTVLGEHGTGKSRLLGEFARWAGGLDDAPVVLTGRTPEPGQGDALAAPAQILAAYCGIRPGDDPVAARRALGERVRALFPGEGDADLMLAQLLPLLGTGAEALLGVVCPEEVVAAWGEFFREAAQHAPVVLCLDDLHHAEDFVLDVIEGLAESAGPRALFVVASAHPGLLRRRPGWAGGKNHASTVTLDRPERFTREQLVEFLLSAARSEGAQTVGR
ncbi:AAA family ATPase [Streptomyces sp. LP05-1]|uniref:AAA family ATPase n=1 Tax=Streptomyces pyxinae TaxID=2970734 RepID=A0ABT2CM35_9ACTN|nr:BTAD domain-containing putative transcriptional regulator [Streptomyces sp. LP05-1]MCS0638385.1 AAA family ATPase [Streptomyces sp. LP05-1]